MLIDFLIVIECNPQFMNWVANKLIDSNVNSNKDDYLFLSELICI